MNRKKMKYYSCLLAIAMLYSLFAPLGVLAEPAEQSEEYTNSNLEQDSSDPSGNDRESINNQEFDDETEFIEVEEIQSEDSQEPEEPLKTEEGLDDSIQDPEGTNDVSGDEVDNSEELEVQESEEPVQSQETNFDNSTMLSQIVEQSTSKLGHINSSSVKIYPDLNDLSKSVTAGSTYTHHVYYIKREAVVNGETYYLLRSKEAGATFGYPGWVKSSDMNVRAHTVVDKDTKAFYVKGSSSAYNHAWGGRENYAYSDLSKYQGEMFNVHLTEKVGNDIWYRGTLGGKTVWIQSSHVTDSYVEKSTSKLGHINSSSVKIYPDLNDLSKSITAGSTYTHHVYYIKREAVVNGETYYLLRSKEAGATFGHPGWVKSSDMNVRAHTVVDKDTKTFYVKGSSSAYNHAWGGRENFAYSNLSTYEGAVFNVHLTEKVGNDIWYRGTLEGKTVWIHSSHVTNYVEKSTSKLGHINSSSVKIYPDLNDLSKSITAGSTYTHHVYYIKREAVVNGEAYYLLRSKEAGATFGHPGWVKSSDMNVRSHTAVDKDTKTFYVKGSSSAYNHAWGGRENVAYSNLSTYEGAVFNVHLTEKVGNDIWYRGTLEGKTVWIQSSHVADYVEKSTSKLGHINSSSVKIYPDLNDLSKSITAGSTYTHHVYYIKREAVVSGVTYYLLRSKEAGATFGHAGWVKSSDLNVRSHTVIDKDAKTFYVKGSSSAYNHAWGGRENYAYSNLSTYQGAVFNVHLTEKVGNDIWYRGTLSGKTVWIHSAHVSSVPLKQVFRTSIAYDLTLDRMLGIQMEVNPQTDTKYKLWLREDAFKKGSISNGKGIVEGTNWNLRRGPGTEFIVDGQVHNGDELPIHSSASGADGFIWYHVKNTTGWVTADKSDVLYYLNPTNFSGNFQNSLQFLDLKKSAEINIDEVNNKILHNAGILKGKASAFVEAASKFGVNEIYLLSHSLLETGNGKSDLAIGAEHNGRIVYNMYGIGANDGCAYECGKEYAYNAGWFTPEAAIIGGAEFVSKNYFARGQDTLYKMRWNPAGAAQNGYASYQYATDIGWALKQTSKMNELYEMLDGYLIHLEIPVYR